MEKITTAGSAAETQELGRKIGGKLRSGDVIALYGDLGSGKTTFVQGIAQGLGITNFVTSPSFVIVNEYPVPSGTALYHIDMYRLSGDQEIGELGIEDLMRNDSIVVIEWAERAEHFLPGGCKKIYFEFISENERRIRTEGIGQ